MDFIVDEHGRARFAQALTQEQWSRLSTLSLMTAASMALWLLLLAPFLLWLIG